MESTFRLFDLEINLIPGPETLILHIRGRKIKGALRRIADYVDTGSRAFIWHGDGNPMDL
jgi:hypothetical protein